MSDRPFKLATYLAIVALGFVMFAYLLPLLLLSLVGGDSVTERPSMSGGSLPATWTGMT